MSTAKQTSGFWRKYRGEPLLVGDEVMHDDIHHVSDSIRWVVSENYKPYQSFVWLSNTITNSEVCIIPERILYRWVVV